MKHLRKTKTSPHQPKLTDGGMSEGFGLGTCPLEVLNARSNDQQEEPGKRYGDWRGQYRGGNDWLYILAYGDLAHLYTTVEKTVDRLEGVTVSFPPLTGLTVGMPI